MRWEKPSQATGDANLFRLRAQPRGTATAPHTLRCAGTLGPRPAGPRSGVQDHQLGFIGSALVRPACSKQHAPVRVLHPHPRERPASPVHRPHTGSACNIYAPSPLRRVLRSSTGRPRSGVQVTSSGSSVPLRPGLPAPSNALSPGPTPPRFRGRSAQSGSSAPHRVGLPSLPSAAPGSTVLNRPAPLGSSGY